MPACGSTRSGAVFSTCWCSRSIRARCGGFSPEPALCRLLRPLRIMVYQTMSNTTDTFVQANEERFLEELKEFLRIPSISTLPEHRGDIDRAAQFVADGLRKVGMENIEIIP